MNIHGRRSVPRKYRRRHALRLANEDEDIDKARGSGLGGLVGAEAGAQERRGAAQRDRKSTRLNSSH